MVKQLIRAALPRWLCCTHLPAREKNTVLLTFDDGPNPNTTPAVLERLRAHSARAVFFVVGKRFHRAPQLLKQIVEEGHALGNHTYSHSELPFAAYRKDLLRCQEGIMELSGYRPRLHRPPLGKLTPASLFSPKTCGLSTMLWSLSSEDWTYQSDDTARSEADRLAQDTAPGDILLFHDEKPYTLTALDRLLPALADKGYNLAPDLDRLG